MQNCKCETFIKKILEHEEKLISILIDLEPRIVAKDEIIRSINCLEGLKNSNQTIFLESVCSYLPMNQPFYSFILNVFTARLVAKKVFYRPAEKQRKLHEALYELFSDVLEGIRLCCDSRKEFLRKYVCDSDVVIFTGKYENAISLYHELSPSTLMFFNGSALNPIIVASESGIERTVQDVINARLYNSGQDCMAPAAIFIQSTLEQKFISLLTEGLKKIVTGHNNCEDVLVGPIINRDYFEENLKHIENNRASIRYGGKSNDKTLLIEPTVFLINSNNFSQYQNIIYAPFFFIFTYDDETQILDYLSTDVAELYKGYISIYGTLNNECEIEKMNYVILKNKTLFDHEEGSKEFGGFGEGCSFVAYRGEIHSKPTLLLREINEILCKNTTGQGQMFHKENG